MFPKIDDTISLPSKADNGARATLLRVQQWPSTHVLGDGDLGGELAALRLGVEGDVIGAGAHAHRLPVAAVAVRHQRLRVLD